NAKHRTRVCRTGRRTTTTIGGRNPRNTYGISTVLWDDRRGPRPVRDQAVQQRNAPGGQTGVGGIPSPASVAGAPSQRRGAQQGRSPAGAGAGRRDPCPALGGAVADLSEVSLQGGPKGRIRRAGDVLAPGASVEPRAQGQRGRRVRDPRCPRW